MAGLHMGVLAFICSCLLVLPSWSDNNQTDVDDNNEDTTIFPTMDNNDDIPSIKERNAILPSWTGNKTTDIQPNEKERNSGEPKGNTRMGTKKKTIKKRNKKEKKLEKKYKKKNKNISTKIGGPACTGTQSDWSCCKTHSCQEKQGDCDSDSECAGSLVCGKNNCKDFNPLAHSVADCCITKPGTGGSSDWAFCSSTSPCNEKQGDCDYDSDCASSLVCGLNNCKYFHPLAESLADCCTKPGILWRPYNKYGNFPSDALKLGDYTTDGDLYVGRKSEHGEVGKINMEHWTYGRMWHLWTHDQGKSTSGQILCGTPNSVKWVSFREGDFIPQGAILAGYFWTDESVLYIGKPRQNNEIGKINIKNGKLHHLWTHDQGKSTEGFILVLK